MSTTTAKRYRSRAYYNGFIRVRAWLQMAGYPIITSPYNSPYDALCNGKRLEIKISQLRNSRQGWHWKFNIHRHGKLDESEVDAYILRLEKVPFAKRRAIHLLLQAPLNKLTISIDPIGLLTRWGKHYNDFSVLTS